MKRRFLLISMCAAVMFSTSCSKEDNESVDTKEVNNQTEVNATKAITVSAKQKSSVSKVALGNKNSENTKYEEVFSEGDILTLYLDNKEIATLELKSGADETTATFGGEIPVSADGQTISAKILPSASPTGLSQCSSFADAVSNYASLSGTFTYNVNDDEFSLDLDDEVSYFVVETNKFSSVDINEDNYTVSNNLVVFAFKDNLTVSSTALGLSNQSLTAGGNVYFKTVNVKTLSVFGHTIEYGDDDTWADMAAKYDWISVDSDCIVIDGKYLGDIGGSFVWSYEKVSKYTESEYKLF